MTVTITLSAEAEKRLRECAARAGQSTEAFLRQLVEQGLLGTEGGGEPDAPAPPGAETLGEILAPVHEDFRKSGMSGEELDALIEECRDELRRNRDAGNAS